MKKLICAAPIAVTVLAAVAALGFGSCAKGDAGGGKVGGIGG